MPSAQASSRLALSQLASGALQSEIRAMSVECDRIGGINLAQGICDTPVPAVVEEDSNPGHPRRQQHLYALRRHRPPAQGNRRQAAPRLRLVLRS